jgi:hypothetical protein
MADAIVEAADAEIAARGTRTRGVQMNNLPTTYGGYTLEEVTRIRFELTAIRQLLEKLVAK